MTRLQKAMLLLGLVAVVWVGIYPPWVETFHYEGAYSEVPLGYGLLADPPAPRKNLPVLGVHIDYGRLVVSWVIVVAITGVFVVVFGSRRP